MANKNYYRYTNSNNNPMSDWGHAMFADSVEKVSCHTQYGHNAWTFEPTENTKHIDDLANEIKEAWIEEQSLYEERGYYSSSNGDDITFWLDEELDADELISLLNPTDIVNSADGWDSDLGIWFYAKIAEKMNLDAVLTDDGAVVWSTETIKRDTSNDW